MKILVAAIAVPVAISLPARADPGPPELHVFGDHAFFSARTDEAGDTRLFYQACNHADHPSAFRWYGAGFAVTAFAELAPGYCAFKQVYEQTPSSAKPHKVKMQGGAQSQVRTWSFDVEDVVSRFLSYVETSVTGPDNALEQSKISVDIRMNGDGTGTMRVLTTGAFDEIVIALPDSGEDPAKGLELISGDVSVEPADLGAETASDEEVSAVDDPQAPALAIIPKTDSGVLAEFSVSGELLAGRRAALYGRIGQRVALATEILFPRRPQ